VSQIRSVDGFSQYQVSCPISPGNSGGPVLDERGRVIGIVSWTKSGAQSVSFAIPSREVARLNVSGKATAWEHFSSDTPPPVAPRWMEADRPVSLEGKAALTCGFEDFATRLEQSAGKHVTVVVLEDGQENKFSFIVPRKALK
jgi:hypothetical protein